MVLGNEQVKTNKGCLLGFVLLSSTQWDKAQFIQNLYDDWGIEAKDDISSIKEGSAVETTVSSINKYAQQENQQRLAQTGEQSLEGDKQQASATIDGLNIKEDTCIFNYENMIVVISMNKAPIPFGEAEDNAANNFLWSDAVEETKKHQAHLMVIIMSKEQDLINGGQLFVEVMASAAKLNNTIGLYTAGTVFEPKMYISCASCIQEGLFPILNLVWFGMYRTDEGISGYTRGLDMFGKSNLEVLNAKNTTPSEIHNFMVNIALYMIEYDVEFEDGETIGLSEFDKHLITKSRGVALPETDTLKIEFENSYDENAE